LFNASKIKKAWEQAIKNVGNVGEVEERGLGEKGHACWSK